ncbi:Regulator of chromosome condensation (RCC1) family protein [Rhynchospora pubera]|uniref:Regulator of chromosome condensation (RCC1) family protein n=1 Tax=Rhynchospora pubera TaxID=906938 RepID=A0AAV8EEW2_9POAL|nr:Regulator of chromosome condensation (RCC1) family protein [Rhynchospora pubera]KAJ4779632.1 Regulator of chromosome condensation (RCC1) family protein [Rhynchospora pubera]
MALLLLRRHFASKPRSASTVPTLYPLDPSSASACASPPATFQLLSWGRGASGQLGDPLERDLRPYPSAVASLSLPLNSFFLSPTPGRLPSPPPSGEAQAQAPVHLGISCGLFHSAIVVDGKVWIWGKGDGGRLGFGDEVSQFVPRLNPTLEGIECVALGGLHSAAFSHSGEVFTWGYGGFGALGHSVYHRELYPRRVDGSWNGKVSHLATSGAHTAAVTDSGEVYTWGRDEGDGRLGLGAGGGPGEAGSMSIPSKVNALPVPVSAVACGGFFTMAITSDGELWSWGANSNFELGRGNNMSDWRPKPVSILQNTRIIQVACGGYHSLALSDEGKVYAWGHGGQGQLGQLTMQNQRAPVVIEALSVEKIVFIACGGSSSAAVSDTGKLYMWGNARDSQLGVPQLQDIQPVPVEVKFLTDNDGMGPLRVISCAIGASHAMCLVSRQSLKWH